MSFAYHRTPRYYLRASNRARIESEPAVGGMRRLPENRAAPLSFAFHRNTLLHLRASNRAREGVGSSGTRGRQSVASGTPSHLTSFASHPSAGLRKTPSKRGRFGTGPHARNPQPALLSWCRVGGGRPVVPRACARSGRVVPTRVAVATGRPNGLRARRNRRAAQSSRWSMPCLETLAFVMSPGIQSGLSLGASSSQAQAS